MGELVFIETLEYAYDDYCIAKMAEKMGKKEIADEFFKRSQNYHNVYNPATSFMQPRDEKGNFAANFSPDDYTEDICESMVGNISGPCRKIWTV